jgi:hypothetical protein
MSTEPRGLRLLGACRQRTLEKNRARLQPVRDELEKLVASEPGIRLLDAIDKLSHPWKTKDQASHSLQWMLNAGSVKVSWRVERCEDGRKRTILYPKGHFREAG